MTSVYFEEKDIDALSADDLDSLIGRAENQRLDFKREIASGDNNNRELARDLCSFANADGGYIIIGAEEDG
jgi:predicted HTH transcriptional regulator